MDLNQLRAARVTRLKHFFLKGDGLRLKALSDECAKEAFLFEDESLLNTGLLAYCFAKFLDKDYIIESLEWKQFSVQMLSDLDLALDYFKQGKGEAGSAVLHSLLKHTENLSESLGRFIKNVVEKARIKTATQMYAHGASLGKAAEMAEANKKELAEYIGATKLQEKYSTVSVKDRVEKIRKLFA